MALADGSALGIALGSADGVALATGVAGEGSFPPHAASSAQHPRIEIVVRMIGATNAFCPRRVNRLPW
jgi:hypothetical protein